MRQPKFRGKQIETGEWLYGSLVWRGERCFILPFEGYRPPEETEVDPKTVGQLTDRPGRDGKEVWEGDITYAETLDGHIDKLIIGWGERGFIQIDEQGYRYSDWLPVIEVIGNIHDTADFSLPEETHNSKLRKYEDDPWRCKNCGSTDVQQQAWVRVDTGEVVSYNDCDSGDFWCDHCEEHYRLVRESELMNTIDYWFENNLKPDDDEVISGLKREDYASDEAFDAACKELWDARDHESKIQIWYELTRDKSNDTE